MQILSIFAKHYVRSFEFSHSTTEIVSSKMLIEMFIFAVLCALLIPWMVVSCSKKKKKSQPRMKPKTFKPDHHHQQQKSGVSKPQKTAAKSPFVKVSNAALHTDESTKPKKPKAGMSKNAKLKAQKQKNGPGKPPKSVQTMDSAPSDENRAFKSEATKSLYKNSKFSYVSFFIFFS